MLFAPKKPVEAAPANKVELHPEYRFFSDKTTDTEIHKVMGCHTKYDSEEGMVMTLRIRVDDFCIR